jgi:hypothetical protein
MKVKNRPQDQFQLIYEKDMPFNLAGETLPAEPPQKTEQPNQKTQPKLLTEA